MIKNIIRAIRIMSIFLAACSYESLSIRTERNLIEVHDQLKMISNQFDTLKQYTLRQHCTPELVELISNIVRCASLSTKYFDHEPFLRDRSDYCAPELVTKGKLSNMMNTIEYGYGGRMLPDLLRVPHEVIYLRDPYMINPGRKNRLSRFLEIPLFPETQFILFRLIKVNDISQYRRVDHAATVVAEQLDSLHSSERFLKKRIIYVDFPLTDKDAKRLENIIASTATRDMPILGETSGVLNSIWLLRTDCSESR